MNKISLKRSAPFLVLALCSIVALFVPTLTNFDEGKYNLADIAWILVATALVFLMTPGLAFFYGGMVNRKNVLSTMMKSVVAAGVVSVLWIAVGYSLCFGDTVHGVIGNPATHFLYKGIASGKPWVFAPTIPKSLFSMFQLMFAIITPGLVVGAIAERLGLRAATTAECDVVALDGVAIPVCVGERHRTSDQVRAAFADFNNDVVHAIYRFVTAEMRFLGGLRARECVP